MSVKMLNRIDKKASLLNDCVNYIPSDDVNEMDKIIDDLMSALIDNNFEAEKVSVEKIISGWRIA